MNIKGVVKRIPFLRDFASRFYYARRTRRARMNLIVRAEERPLRIVVGASDVYDNDWIPTDVEVLDLLDTNDWEIYFKRNSIDAILAEHVWEHLTPEEGAKAAQTCYEFLKVDGYMRVAVPDGYHPRKEYIDWVKVGGSGPGSDDHKVLYTYRTFSELFESAGFRVKILEYFDENGNFSAQEWDIRAGMIHRSAQFDERNPFGQLNYTSIIIDAYK